MKRHIVLVVLVCLLIGVWALSSNEPRPETVRLRNADKNTIIMLDSGFSPTRIVINRGENVTFINQGGDLHWPASDNHPTHEEHSDFDPKRPIKAGFSWSFNFSVPGEYKFHDHLYPNYTGSVVVNP